MMENKNNRDILDLGTPSSEVYPAENLPTTDVNRPRVESGVSPQEGGYFLNKFLEGGDKPADEAETQKGEAPADKETLEANIVAALQEIFDPEIPVNIYELGLIYGIDIDDDWQTRVTMTLTTPHCPVAESMPGEVELKVMSVPGVKACTVALVWEPAWDMSKMSDEARLELGLL